MQETSNNSRRYYAASGRVSLAAPLKVVIYGVPGAAVLAALYSVVIRYNPFVYFSCVATLMFGLCLGLVATLACEKGRSRSGYFNAFAAGVIAAMGLWLHWVIWTALVYDEGYLSARNLATSSPIGWLDFLSFTARNRQLTIGRLGRAHADTSAGFMYWAWSIEALMVVAVALFAVGTSKTPFSEKTRTWSRTDWEGEVPAPSQDAPGADDIENRLDREGIEWLVELAAADLPGSEKMPGTRLQLTCTSVPDDPDCCYLSVVAVTRQGAKNSTSSKPLVKYRGLDAASYARLMSSLRQGRA